MAIYHKMKNGQNGHCEEGNTSPPRYRGKKYVFTLNNYSKGEMDSLDTVLNKISIGYIYGEEVGECGTPHLQGYVEFKSRMDWTSLKKINPRIHWEKKSPKSNREQNIVYCSKGGKVVSTFEEDFNIEQEILKEEYSNVIWKDWQQKIIDIIEGPIDRRKIYWFWEKEGNVGKSFLSTYLCLKYDAIVCSGKESDVKHSFAVWLEAHKLKNPKVCLVDIPRSKFDGVSYSTLEEIKNQVMQNTKYECHRLVFRRPHIIVFANYPPKREKLSQDRWDITELNHNPILIEVEEED